MRARRVRFTRPRVRELQPATRRRDGVETFRHSNAGRHAKMEAIGAQRERQESICPRCNGYLELTDSKFESKEFTDGVENRVVHRTDCA